MPEGGQLLNASLDHCTLARRALPPSLCVQNWWMGNTMAGKAGEQGGLQQGDCCPDNLHSNAKSYSNSLYFTFKIKLIIIVSTSHLL